MGTMMDDYLESWKTMLDDALKENGESWDDVVSSTMTKTEMNRKFDPGFGAIEGIPFTVWTKKSVYFPVCYDGAESIGRVSRYPDGKPTEHHGS